MQVVALSNAVVARVRSSAAPVKAANEPHDAVVEALFGEVLAVPAHWDTRSPAGARCVVEREMRRRHPELSDLAIEALGAHFAEHVGS